MSATKDHPGAGLWYRHLRWMYRSGRPNALARLLNRLSAGQYAAGLAPGHWVTLEVPGRRTGRTISFPLVIADHEGERYLVAASDGRVTLCGFSDAYSEELAGLYAQAFPK